MSRLEGIQERLDEWQRHGSIYASVARDDYSALLDVVREVAALHRRETVYAWAEDCPERDEAHTENRHVETGNAYEYICLDSPVSETCSHCVSTDEESVPYPCPTATALAPLTKEETDGR